MKANDFDKKFDEGTSIMPYVDKASAQRQNKKVKRVNVDFPTWMLDELDNEANRLGVSRQALVKVWIADCLSKKIAI